MKKPAFKKTKTRTGKGFWDSEYSDPTHLRLSDKPSEDLEGFIRFVYRLDDHFLPTQHIKVLDLGCGNGRNLIYLAKARGARGIGYDTSQSGIAVAKKASEGLPLTYVQRSIAGMLDVPDGSQDIVLDMMTSHFLSKDEREFLLKEIVRVLKPGAWLFMKTFLADGDRHIGRLLDESPTEEEGTYIHPKIGVPEHVYTEDEIVDFVGGMLDIRKIHKSHKHILGKRRTISIAAQKPVR